MSIGIYAIPKSWVYQKIVAANSLWTNACYPEENTVSDNISDVSGNGAYITYTFRNNTPTPTKSGVSQLDEVVLLINIFESNSFNNLVLYSGQIRDALDGYSKASPGASEFYVQSCSFEDQDTGFDDDFGVEGMYFNTMQFKLRISKN